jgi:hypothetical protein
MLKLSPRIVEVKSALHKTGTAWKVGMMRDDGNLALSEQTFDTEREANLALQKWRVENADKFSTIQ